MLQSQNSTPLENFLETYADSCSEAGDIVMSERAPAVAAVRAGLILGLEFTAEPIDGRIRIIARRRLDKTNS